MDVDSLTLEQLKALRRKWYQDAVEDGSLRLCYKICERLGEQYGRYRKYRWSGQGIVIIVDNHGGYMRVEVNGRLVCNTHALSQLFVPGGWMDVLRTYEEVTNAKIGRARRRAHANERQALIAELCLEEEV